MSEMRDRRDTRNDAMEGNAPTARPADSPPPTTQPVRENRDAMARARAPEQTRDTRDAMPHQTEMWPDMADMRQRFDEIQSEFIEDPKAAVKKAEKLVEEAIERITKSMREQMSAMHRDVDGKDGDTEMLRQTMRGYRAWMETMGSRRAA